MVVVSPLISTSGSSASSKVGAPSTTSTGITGVQDSAESAGRKALRDVLRFGQLFEYTRSSVASSNSAEPTAVPTGFTEFDALVFSIMRQYYHEYLGLSENSLTNEKRPSEPSASAFRSGLWAEFADELYRIPVGLLLRFSAQNRWFAPDFGSNGWLFFT